MFFDFFFLLSVCNRCTLCHVDPVPRRRNRRSSHEIILTCSALKPQTRAKRLAVFALRGGGDVLSTGAAFERACRARRRDRQ